MTARRLFNAIVGLAALVLWGVNAPRLVDMTRYGEIMPIAFLLFLVAVIALAVAVFRIHFGKAGRVALALHIVFACGGLALMGMFDPARPLLLSLSFAVGSLAWSFIDRSAQAV